MATPLSSGIQFLKDLGFYDVILPFLLIFTIVFGVLEKTKIFGTVENKPKTNINSMIAFVIALFFVATPRLVEAVHISLPQVSLLLVVVMSLMMLVGFIASEKEGFSFDKYRYFKGFLIFIFFIGIVLIFLNAIGWWDEFWDMFGANFWTSTAGMTLIFFGVIIGAIFFITTGSGAKKESE